MPPGPRARPAPHPRPGRAPCPHDLHLTAASPKHPPCRLRCPRHGRQQRLRIHPSCRPREHLRPRRPRSSHSHRPSSRFRLRGTFPHPALTPPRESSRMPRHRPGTTPRPATTPKSSRSLLPRAMQCAWSPECRARQPRNPPQASTWRRAPCGAIGLRRRLFPPPHRRPSPLPGPMFTTIVVICFWSRILRSIFVYVLKKKVAPKSEYLTHNHTNFTPSTTTSALSTPSPPLSFVTTFYGPPDMPTDRPRRASLRHHSGCRACSLGVRPVGVQR